VVLYTFFIDFYQLLVLGICCALLAMGYYQLILLHWSHGIAQCDIQSLDSSALLPLVAYLL